MDGFPGQRQGERKKGRSYKSEKLQEGGFGFLFVKYIFQIIKTPFFLFL